METEKVGFTKDPTKWYKSRSKRMVFGVLGGYSDKTGINVVLLRIIFLATTPFLLPITGLTYFYLAITRPEDPLFIKRKNKVTKLIEETPGHDGAFLSLDRVGFVNSYYFMTFGLITFISFVLIFYSRESSDDPLVYLVMILSFGLGVFANVLNTKIQIASYQGWFQNTIFALLVAIICSLAFIISINIDSPGGLIFEIPLLFLIALSTFQLYTLTKNPDIKWLFNITKDW
jgi:phage shock protein PspC (stress-responsive transcriptional regulator)